MAELNNSIQEQENVKRENRTILVALSVVVAVVIVLAIIGFFLLTPPAEIIEGQAEATSVRISGKLPGRVMEFYVEEGDYVNAGDTLVHIHSSLAEAKLMQAEAMQTAATAQDRKVDAGARSQIKQAAYELWQQAMAAKSIAKKTSERMQALFAEGVIAEQKRDEALAAYQAADAAEKAAHSQYDLAMSGAQSEDKEAASAMVNVAKGGVAEVQALLDDQYLVAPCAGQIDVIYPQEGELVALGAPIMNLLKVSDKWVTFNVREELLKDLPIGQEIEIMIPALDKKRTKAKVYYVRDLGSYAVWRATKATGEWDSRTFQVKARPVEDIQELRPGMSIIYNPD
jgi:HlyD family secretion protein